MNAPPRIFADMAFNTFTCALLLALLGASSVVRADPGAPVQDFARVCASEQPDLAAWRISGALARESWPTRLRCADEAGTARALRIEVRPGDAYDPNPGEEPTERVEIQVRREFVKFDQTVWYSFRFRLAAPWPTQENRTVIHQVKQNVEAKDEIVNGGRCPSANPFFKIETGHRKESAGPAFVVKTRGTDNCNDGKSGQAVCGPWPLQLQTWHRVHVVLKPSLREGGSNLRVWLDGKPCAPQTGRLGYADVGRRDKDGKPFVDAQPRFGIYRDALRDVTQTITYTDIAFWDRAPAGHPDWAGIGLTAAP